MAEDTMNEEMTGMAAPAPEAPMLEDTMGDAPKSSELTVDAMKANYEAMESDKQLAVKEIMNEAIGQLFDELTGQTVMSEFAMSIRSEEPMGAEAPSAEGMMAPSTEPMADMPAEEEEATPPV